MIKPLAVLLLVAGVALLIIGWQASQSFSSDLSRFFTGEPTDRAIWYLVGGAVASVAGLVMLLRGSK